MKKTTLLITMLILTIIAIVGCKPTEYTKEVNTPLNALEFLDFIDGQYKTNWKQEQLNGTMTPAKEIDKIIAKIAAKKPTGPTLNENVSRTILEARIEMLETEKLFQEQQKLDPRPLAKMLIYDTGVEVNASIDQFKCDENTEKATKMLPEIHEKAIEVANKIDYIMQWAPETRELIGTNLQRPRWYDMELGRVMLTFKINNILLNTKCKGKDIQELTKEEGMTIN